MKMLTCVVLGLTFLVLFSINSLTYGAEKISGVTSDSIRIGVSVPLTKAFGNAGRQSSSAMQAYLAHINEMGGIHGRKVVLIIDDSQYDPNITLGIFKKQVTSDNIFAHIVWGVATVAPLIKPAMEEKVPLLATAGAKPFFIPPKKYVFCFMPPFELQAAACVTYIHDILKKKDAKIAIFWRNDDYGKTALIGGKTAASYYNLNVVAEPSYIMGQSIDFTPEVMKIERANADFVLLGSAVGDVVGFLREAKNQGLKATIIGALSPCGERKIIHMAGDPAENYISVFSAAMFRETQIPGVKKMLEISKKYAPKDVLAEESSYYIESFHYIEAMVEGLKNAGPNPTPEKLIQGLEMLKDYTGEGLGPPISFSPTKRYSSGSFFLGQANMKIKDFDRITDRITPPQDLTNLILK